MKIKHLPLLLLSLFAPLVAEEPLPTTSQLQKNSPPHQLQIIINNHPLAKINGKIISLIDVIKKMELFLYEYDPNIELSKAERAQFYMSRWEPTLEELICNELVILDAKQKQIEISDGEVRQELDERFGPNIMANLEKVGLSYDEARDWIRDELMIRQMMWYKVHSKVLQTITPKTIKTAYETYLEKNPPTETWTYRVFSVRGKDKQICEELANEAYKLLSKGDKTLDEISNALKENNQTVTITLTNELTEETRNISKQHHQVIKDLTPQTFSSPISQLSRFDNSAVSRIFYLNSTMQKLPSDFDAMHDSIKNQLLTETADKEKELYFTHLKKRYGLHQNTPRIPLPENYQPFAIY